MTLCGLLFSVCFSKNHTFVMGDLGQHGGLEEEDSSTKECKELLPVRLLTATAVAVTVLGAKSGFL